MREDRNVLDLLTADYTFVNERLAQALRHPEHLRIALPPRDAAGRSWTTGAGCSARAASCRSPGRRISGRRRSSAACGCSRTSSARRRRSRRRTCRRSRTRTAGSAKMLTLREQMTLHRKNPPCAGCHKIMDPIGFALENFDADGKWRTKQGGDGGTPIDASVDAVRRPGGRRTGRAAAGAAALFAAVRPDVHREDDDLRAGPRRRIHRHAGDPRRSCAMRRRTTTGSRRSCWASSRARSSRCE